MASSPVAGAPVYRPWISTSSEPGGFEHEQDLLREILGQHDPVFFLFHHLRVPPASGANLEDRLLQEGVERRLPEQELQLVAIGRAAPVPFVGPRLRLAPSARKPPEPVGLVLGVREVVAEHEGASRLEVVEDPVEGSHGVSSMPADAE